jgi:arginine/lysine/ornithine decarboxylase
VLRPFALPKASPVRVLSPREALFAPREEVPIGQALGRICAEVAVSCPPAVPPVMCGERIDEAVIAVCRYYGIENIFVIKR